MDRPSVLIRIKGFLGSKKGLALVSVIALAVGGIVFWKKSSGSAAKSHGSHEVAKKGAHSEHGSHAAEEHDSDHRKPASAHHEAAEEEATESPVESAHSDSHPGDSAHKDAGHEQSDHAASQDHRPFLTRLWASYAGLFHSIQSKVEEIQSLDLEKRRLELEVANLRRWSESLKFGCEAANAEKKTRKSAARLSIETGAEMGRTLASIRYTPPANLLPQQLHALAVSYFKAKEDEKAAVIFTFLTGLEEDSTYKTPKNYLLTGVTWYRLDHWVEANSYFDRVLKEKPTAENLSYQAKARLWKALVAQKMNQKEKSQALLRDLMDHHPRSPEVEWVNTKQGKRVIASEPMEIIETDRHVGEEEHVTTSHSHH